VIMSRTRTAQALSSRSATRMRNLPQVEVGDILTITYSESIAVQVVKPTEPSRR